MNKEELLKLGYLNKEIELLKKQIKDAEFSVKCETVTDCVRGSSTEFPYTQHTIKITGIDVEDYERKVNILKKRLGVRLKELMDRVEEINECINTVEDSETRMILQYKYIRGLTWEELEDELYINKRTAQRKFKKWCEINS